MSKRVEPRSPIAASEQRYWNLPRGVCEALTHAAWRFMRHFVQRAADVSLPLAGPSVSVPTASDFLLDPMNR